MGHFLRGQSRVGFGSGAQTVRMVGITALECIQGAEGHRGCSRGFKKRLRNRRVKTDLNG